MEGRVGECGHLGRKGRWVTAGWDLREQRGPSRWVRSCQDGGAHCGYTDGSERRNMRERRGRGRQERAHAHSETHIPRTTHEVKALSQCPRSQQSQGPAGNTGAEPLDSFLRGWDGQGSREMHLMQDT